MNVLLLCLSLCLVDVASGDLTIDELVHEAGLVAGPLAMRDRPGWRGAHKILVMRIGEDDLAALRAAHPDTDFAVAESIEAAIPAAADVDAIIGTCNRRVIDAATRLVWVQIYWAGAERCLAVPRIGSGDVVLTNMQKMSAPVIGEHAVAMAMALARQLPGYTRDMQAGAAGEPYAARPGMVYLTGKTMLVIGLGGIGTEAARRAAGLGMRVIGTRNSSREGPEFVDYVGLSHELPQLAARADVIVNALPLTKTTEGLLDAEFFAAVRPGAIFVNVGRGATVDTDALLAALKTGAVSGAGLDVTDPEPLPDGHPLWQLDNVIITPHVAGRGGERERHFVLLTENLRRYAAGDALLNVVDPDKGY